MKHNKTVHILAVITALSLMLNLFMIGSAYMGTKPGDMDGNGVVDEEDAIYLLQHVLMPDMFPLVPGDDQNDNMENLSVGFGRVNITPDFAATMISPMGEAYTSEGFLDYLYLTCLAVTEGEETILIFTADTYSISNDILSRIRSAVSSWTDIPADRIFAYATHTQAAPKLAETYLNCFLDYAKSAAKQALKDRAPAKVLTGRVALEDKNAVNHYILADGTYAGPNFGNLSNADIPVVGHAGVSDNQLVLVRFERVGEDKKDIMLANWQAHPDFIKTEQCLISADFPGAMREMVEKETGMHFAYFTGAAGDVSADSILPGKQHGLGMREYGEMLANEAVKALSDLKEVGNSGLKIAETRCYLSVDHSWDHMLPEANEVYEVWKIAGEEAGENLAKQYGFSSVYQARKIRSCASRPATVDMKIQVFSIGDIGFVSVPYEMYSGEGLYIRENSPFSTTFICSQNSGCFPSKDAYEYLSFDVYNCYYVSGTAEELAEAYVKLLKEIK